MIACILLSWLWSHPADAAPRGELRCAHVASRAGAASGHEDAARQRSGLCFDGAAAGAAAPATLTPARVERNRQREPFPPSRYGEPYQAPAAAPYRPAGDPDSKKETPKEKNVTPYQGLIDMAQILMMIASMLLLAANVFLMLGKGTLLDLEYNDIAKALGYAALAISVMVIGLGLAIIAQADQKLQGLMLMLAGVMVAFGAWQVITRKPSPKVQPNSDIGLESNSLLEPRLPPGDQRKHDQGYVSAPTDRGTIHDIALRPDEAKYSTPQWNTDRNRYVLKEGEASWFWENGEWRPIGSMPV
ncbi:MAG: hypothetical protein HY553_04590 [Elusimicrobia bacterium]|nr:hypothetical protein [Elusimicrobiota bacterium]